VREIFEGKIMDANEHGLVCGPEELKLLWAAFDDCWRTIKSYYSDDLDSIEAGRLRLANVLLAEYRDGVTDLDELKICARRWMQLWGSTERWRDQGRLTEEQDPLSS
jgi:hypothetical protein